MSLHQKLVCKLFFQCRLIYAGTKTNRNRWHLEHIPSIKLAASILSFNYLTSLRTNPHLVGTFTGFICVVHKIRTLLFSRSSIESTLSTVIRSRA